MILSKLQSCMHPDRQIRERNKTEHTVGQLKSTKGMVFIEIHMYEVRFPLVLNRLVFQMARAFVAMSYNTLNVQMDAQ